MKIHPASFFKVSLVLGAKNYIYPILGGNTLHLNPIMREKRMRGFVCQDACANDR
jgi:hypothetical protein